MSETVQSSLEKHSILVVGSSPSAFPGDDILLLRNPLVRLWGKKDVRDDNTIPEETKVLIFCDPEIGRERVPILKRQIANRNRRQPPIEEFHTFNQEALKKALKGKLKLAVPLARPSSENVDGDDLSKDLSVDRTVEVGEDVAELRPPGFPVPAPLPSLPFLLPADELTEGQTTLPPASPQSDPSPPPAVREVKLPPSGAEWKLPDFIRANAERNTSFKEEVVWMLAACHQHGFPTAQKSNVEQHIRKSRGGSGARASRTAESAVVAQAEDSPVVSEFLVYLGQLVAKATVAAEAIRQERVGYKAEIQVLKSENEGLKGKLANAVQAAELLKGLTQA